MVALDSIKPKTDDAEVVRLVGRLAYGPDPATLEQARRLGYEGFVESQLDYQSIDDSELEDTLAARLPTLDDNLAELISDMGDERFQSARELIIATLARQWFSRRQLFQRMVEFWSDHFNISIGNGILALLKPIEDREVIRAHALGDFSRLLEADAKSPAMLYYLDNYNNTKDGPNENYAREVMELHTIGVDGGYTETDVEEAARCFTGWTIRRPPRAGFVFNPMTHDWGRKQVIGLKLPARGGVADGERLLAYLAAHEATARRISTKLLQRFVSDNPTPDLVERVAHVFSDSSGDIKVTLRAMLLDADVRSAPPLKLKRPGEFIAGALRALQINARSIPAESLRAALKSMGHVPFRWPAPNGYPDTAAYWQSSNGFLTHFNLAFNWTDAAVNSSPVLRAARDFRSDARALVDYLAQALVPAGIETATRNRLIAYAGALRINARTAAVAGQLLAAPESQWR